MRLRRTLAAVAISLAAALTVGTLSAPARATSPDPLRTLLSPSILDPVVNLLAAFPTKPTPYRGTLCPGGEPRCIEDVITEMQQRLVPLAKSCSHDAIFSLAYLRVTESVKHAADNGYFADRKWLTQLDAEFAEMYFDVMDAWKAGRRNSVPKAWKIALSATEGKKMSGLGDFLLNMNAHINNDFPYVLEMVGLTAPDGTSHKADHNAYNQRLDSLYKPVFDEEAARFDPMFNKFDLGPVDELMVGAIMRGWREVVWRHAEALVNAPAALRPLVQKEISEYAAGQAQFIQLLFASPSPTKRAAYCAVNHG